MEGNNICGEVFGYGVLLLIAYSIITNLISNLIFFLEKCPECGKYLTKKVLMRKFCNDTNLITVYYRCSNCGINRGKREVPPHDPDPF